MTELIKIGENEMVNARDLHSFMEVKSRFNDWIKNRIEEYSFEEGIDYELVTKILVTNNPKNPQTEVQDYAITLDMAKELSMVERNEKGREARQYFIRCEKAYKHEIRENRRLLLGMQAQINEMKATKPTKKISDGEEKFVKLKLAARMDSVVLCRKIVKFLEKKEAWGFSGNHLLVYSQILFLADENGRFAINDKDMRVQCGLSLETFQTCKRELINRALIRVQKRKLTNYYVL